MTILMITALIYHLIGYSGVWNLQNIGGMHIRKGVEITLSKVGMSIRERGKI